MSKFVTAKAVWESKTYEATLARDVVPLFCDGKLIGTGRWQAKKRVVHEWPDLPSGLARELTRQLKIGLVSARIQKKEKAKRRKAQPLKSQVKELFEVYEFPALPENCVFWARVHIRQFYTVFVGSDNGATVFRNTNMIGAARWEPTKKLLLGYSGEAIPDRVWEHLTLRLAEHPIFSDNPKETSLT